jgi:hypothetical protein
MSIRIRIIDLRRTFVLNVWSRDTDLRSRQIWIAIHPRERDWAVVFCNALDLLMETVKVDRQRIRFAEGAGLIAWQRKAFSTIICLEISAFSEKKRHLLAAALLKSARYSD